MMKIKQKLRAGDWVEVLGKNEILKNLDQRGMIDDLPFMPEMVRYSGHKFKIFKRAHKTCDPPNGLDSRRLEKTVHLEGVRCDGQAHGGCQAGCLIFWKEAWLKKREPEDKQAAKSEGVVSSANDLHDPQEGWRGAAAWAGICPPAESEGCDDPTYVCQSTQLSKATKPWRWWDLRQYVEDYTSGNVRLSQMLSSLLFHIYATMAGAGIGLGSGLRWMYDRFQKLRGGTPYPWRMGKIPRGTTTPSVKLNLQPGEMVRVKSYLDILATLDEDRHNRGMYFDGEMVPYTGNPFRVLQRVEKIIDEKTGKLMNIKSDAIVLENVTCQARYSKCRTFCTRSIFPFWREVWLERIDSNDKG